VKLDKVSVTFEFGYVSRSTMKSAKVGLLMLLLLPASVPDPQTFHYHCYLKCLELQLYSLKRC